MSLTPAELARLRALVALAADPRTPHHEAASAAIAACKGLDKSKLLLQSGGGGERGGGWSVPYAGVVDIDAVYGDDRVVRLAARYIVVVETQRSYRVAVASPESRSKGSMVVGWVPKKLLVEPGVEWLDPAEAKRLYGTARPVIDVLHVRKRDVDELRRATQAKEWRDRG